MDMYDLAELLRKGIQDFTAEMPITKLVRGGAEDRSISKEGLAKALRDMPKPFQVPEKMDPAAEAFFNPTPMSGLAGVVKPKGGNWIHTQTTVNDLAPKMGQFAAGDKYTERGMEEFAANLEKPYRDRLDKWVKTHMGTAEDPLKDVPIPNTPYTWGELGDELVRKLRKEDVEIHKPREYKIDPETGDYLRNAGGMRVVDTLPPEVLVNTGGRQTQIENPKLAEQIAKFAETGEGDYYRGDSTRNAIIRMVKSLRETPREGYIEPNPAWKEGESRKWIPGKDVMGPLPAWKGGDLIERQGAVTGELQTLLQNVGEYGGDVKVPRDREFNLGKDFPETIPDIIKTWPGKFKTHDLQNVERNKLGLVKENIPTEPGYGWYKHTDPEGVKREGKLMRHCIGNYCENVGDSANFYSLRDERFMTPAVSLSTDIQKPRVSIEPRAYWDDIVGGLRNPAPGVEPVRDPQFVGRVRAAEEVHRNPRHYGADPEALDDQHPLEYLLQQMNPEDRAYFERFITANGPTTEAVSQVKGTANSPVSPQYVQNVLNFLRNKQDLTSGALQHGEARYAQVLPYKDDYIAIDEGYDKVRGMLEDAVKTGAISKLPSDLRSLMRNYDGDVGQIMAQIMAQGKAYGPEFLMEYLK